MHLPWCNSLFRHADEPVPACNCGNADIGGSEPHARDLITRDALDRLINRCIDRREKIKPGALRRLKLWLGSG